MKHFYAGFILGVIVFSLLYAVIFRPQETPITNIGIQVDTLYVEVIDTVYIEKYKIKPQIIYRDEQEISYTAIIDTTIVQEKVTGQFITSFHHPQKFFDIVYNFQVKSDSVTVYIKQTIKETVYVKPSKFSLAGQGYFLKKKTQQDIVLGAGITGYIDRYGLTFKGQTNGYIGIGVSIKF